MTGVPSAVLDAVASVQPYHTDCQAWTLTSKQHVVIELPVRLEELGHLPRSLDG